jgi:hypothetical protein
LFAGVEVNVLGAEEQTGTALQIRVNQANVKPFEELLGCFSVQVCLDAVIDGSIIGAWFVCMDMTALDSNVSMSDNSGKIVTYKLVFFLYD